MITGTLTKKITRNNKSCILIKKKKSAWYLHRGCLCTVLPPRGPRHTQWKHSPLFSVSCKHCSLEPPSKRSTAAIHHTLELFTKRMKTFLLCIKNISYIFHIYLGLLSETNIYYYKLTINMKILYM